jgi:hypothetical protein
MSTNYKDDVVPTPNDIAKSAGVNKKASDNKSESFEAITSQEQLDSLFNKRFKDYKELQEKAQTLEKLENAKKSELEKKIEKINYLENELKRAKVSNLRAELFSKSKLPNEMLSFVNGETQTDIQAQIDKLQSVITGQNNVIVPNEQNTINPPTLSSNESPLVSAVREFKENN